MRGMGMGKELQERFDLLRRELESVRQYLQHLEAIALDIQKFAGAPEREVVDNGNDNNDNND